MASPNNRKMKLHYGQQHGNGSAVSQRKWIRLGVMVILVNLALYISVFGGGSNFDKAKEKQRKKHAKKLRKQKRKQNKLRKKSGAKASTTKSVGAQSSQQAGDGSVNSIETGTLNTGGDDTVGGTVDGDNVDPGVRFS